MAAHIWVAVISSSSSSCSAEPSARAKGSLARSHEPHQPVASCSSRPALRRKRRRLVGGSSSGGGVTTVCLSSRATGVIGSTAGRGELGDPPVSGRCCASGRAPWPSPWTPPSAGGAVGPGTGSSRGCQRGNSAPRLWGPLLLAAAAASAPERHPNPIRSQLPAAASGPAQHPSPHRWQLPPTQRRSSRPRMHMHRAPTLTPRGRRAATAKGNDGR